MRKDISGSRTALIAVLLCVLLVLAGCGRVIDTVLHGVELLREVSLSTTPTPIPTPTPWPTATPTATLWPTATPSPTSTTEAAQARVPATATPTQPVDTGPFTIEITEQELNSYLKAESFSGDGLTISDVTVSLTPQEAIVNLRATHRDLGISMGVTLYGQPQVIDGTIYLRITRVELDDSVRGFTRLIAQALVEAAINQYAQPHGIPITIEGVEVEKAELAQGKLIVTGRMAQ
jgi:hypothetical protein